MLLDTNHENGNNFIDNRIDKHDYINLFWFKSVA